MVLVDEDDIERAVNAYLTLQKTMAEGAGAAGLAALLAEPERFRGRKVGLVLSGGNIDPRLLASIMVRELVREKRIVSFRLIIADQPGLLGQIATSRRARRQHPRGEHRPPVPRRAGQGRRSTSPSRPATPAHTQEIIEALAAEGFTPIRIEPGAAMEQTSRNRNENGFSGGLFSGTGSARGRGRGSGTGP